MMCSYCGVAVQAGCARCSGCGAPGAHPLAEPAGTAASIYEQIGRSVVSREPSEALDRLLRVGERKTASTREQQVARATKIIICLTMVWQFPMILMVILPVAMTFFMWIYLPYIGLRRLLGWLSS